MSRGASDRVYICHADITQSRHAPLVTWRHLDVTLRDRRAERRDRDAVSRVTQSDPDVTTGGHADRKMIGRQTE